MPRHILRVLVLGSLIGIAVLPAHWVGAQTATTAPAGDAAALYRQAFALMKGVENAPELDEPQTAALTEATGRLLKECEQPMRLVREAAACRTCDWGWDGQDVQGTLTHLNQARFLTYLTVLQSRWDLQHGRPQEAVDDLLAAMALSRHVGAPRILVCRLAELGIDQVAVKQLARELPRLPRDVVARLPEELRQLPAGVTNSQTILAEYEFGKRQAAQQGQPMQDWFAALQGFYQALADSADLPPAEFAAKVDAELAKVALNPFAKTIAPTLKRIREPQAAGEAKRAMLQTAINVILTGPSAVEQSHDPFGTGPFRYQKTSGGFELTSALPGRGEPIKLVVGEEAHP